MANEEHSGTPRCAVWGRENETFVNILAGSRQSCVGDRGICDRSSVLRIKDDELTGEISIEAELEG
jgi:hypothetical protein